jgi:DNA (cytosine-5)-methyltransferase 1
MPRDTARLAVVEPVRAPRLKKALIADLFCGAGGSSTGAKRALLELDIKMDLLCVNHWPTAIDTHTRNHPEARHYCQDVSTVRPHIVVPEGRLDLLMASPTCTFHSRARGGKPISDQQRMDPWHIIGWLSDLRVKRLLIENVPEFMRWGPVDPRTGRPIKNREGEYFIRWVETIKTFFKQVDFRIVNCANYGDPTTRERFFLMATNSAKPLRWPAATHAKRGATKGGLFAKALQPWPSARDNVIDWSIRGRSIFDRKRPLSPKTLARIYAGAQKFGWPEPFLVVLRNHMAGQSVDGPLPTITGGGTHIGLAEPVVFQVNQGGDRKRNIRSVLDPLQTVVTRPSLGLAEPFVLSSQNSGAPRSTEEPLPTITTGGAGNAARPGCARPALIEAFVMSGHAGGAPRSVDEPIPGMTAMNNGPLVVEPFVLNRHGDNGSTRAHSVEEPIPTADCRGAGYVVEPMIAPYYGSGSGETCQGVDKPLPSVTTKGRFGLVVPVTQSGGGPNARSVEDPLPTLTTAKGGEFAMVMPVTHDDTSSRARSADEPLPTVTAAPRGELAFIAAQFGERKGQAPRVHDIGEPAPTLCAEGRIQLVEPGRDFDILFRMLEPHELAAAMSFNVEDQRYEFAGTKTDIIKQIGNAVPCRTAAALVRALFEE